MVGYVPICKTYETSANMQDMCRYVPIYADMHDILQGMLTYIDMKKLAKKVVNIARYAGYVTICHNMLSNGEPQSSVICSNSPV